MNDEAIEGTGGASDGASADDTDNFPAACAYCHKDITREDIAGGLAFQRDDRVVCRECARKLLKSRAAGEGAETQTLVAEIQRDIEAIKREIFIGRFSIWNVIGGVAQAAALAAGVLALASNSEPYWFIALQLLALTLVIMGKR